MFKKILTATDMVGFCDAPVATAAIIARQTGAELDILHLLESDSPIEREFVRHFKTKEEIVCNGEYIETVKEEIEKGCDYVLGPDLNYKIHVKPGFPWLEILRLGRKQRSDLVVLGPHTGRAQEMGVVRVCGRIGSTAQGVIERERCPVMLVNHLAEDRLRFKKIVVGTDFSRSCESALSFAIKVAVKNGSKLTVFHVMPEPAAPQYVRARYDENVAELRNRLDEFCRVIPKEIEYETRMWEGASPPLEILKCANLKDADLIVMGSHTKDREGKWYVGSAVEGVSYRSNCPVFVITDPKVLLKL